MPEPFWRERLDGFVDNLSMKKGLITFRAAIAATVLSRRDKLLVLDSDFDRLKDRIELLRPK
jgi:hypothetical protein